MVLFALSRLTAKTGESFLDINEKLRKEILNYFKDHNCQENNIVKHVANNPRTGSSFEDIAFVKNQNRFLATA